MKTVLLPTDFSKNAWNAIFTALKLFHNIQCKFILFHTYEPSLTEVFGDQGEKRLGTIYQSMEEDSRRQMAEILSYLKEHHQNPRHEFKVLIRPGDFIGEVRERIKKYPVDFVVMGTQGATGAQRVMLGSNTVRMLKTIRNRPVLAVPQTYDFQRLDHVVFPTDYTRYYEPYELQPLLDLLKAWKSTLHVTYAAREFKLKPAQQSNKELLKTRLEGFNVRFEEAGLKSNLSQAISDFAISVRADMIVLMQHRYSFLENLTREKVVKRIAFDSKLPLLILPQFL